MVFSDMRTRELSKYLKIKPKVCQADSFKDPLPWFWRCVLIKAEIMILNMQLRKTKAPDNISVSQRFSSTWSLSDWESFGGLSSWYCKHWYSTVDSSLLIFCYLMFFFQHQVWQRYNFITALSIQKKLPSIIFQRASKSWAWRAASSSTFPRTRASSSTLTLTCLNWRSST